MNPRARWLPLLALLASCEAASTPLAPEPSRVAASGQVGELHVVQVNTPIPDARKCAWIGSGGGTIELAPARLDFPGGALAQRTEICLVVGGQDLEVTFEPHGLRFPANARPRLRIDYRDAKNYLSSSLRVAYIDPATNAILEVITTEVDVGSHEVRTFLDHFSTFALASN